MVVWRKKSLSLFRLQAMRSSEGSGLVESPQWEQTCRVRAPGFVVARRDGVISDADTGGTGVRRSLLSHFDGEQSFRAYGIGPGDAKSDRHVILHCVWHGAFDRIASHIKRICPRPLSCLNSEAAFQSATRTSIPDQGDCSLCRFFSLLSGDGQFLSALLLPSIPIWYRPQLASPAHLTVTATPNAASVIPVAAAALHPNISPSLAAIILFAVGVALAMFVVASTCISDISDHVGWDGIWDLRM